MPKEINTFERGDGEKLSEDIIEDLVTYIEDLYQFMPQPLYYANPAGFIVEINKMLEKLTGYTVVELVGQSASLLFANEEDAINIKEETVKKGKVKDRELTILTKEKREILVTISTSLRKDKEGNIIGYFAALVDITERKRLEEKIESASQEKSEYIEELRKREKELEESYEFTNALLDNIPAPFILTDKKGKWKLVNKAFEDFTGYSREELLGKETPEQKCATKETVEATKKLWEHTTEKREMATGDVPWLTKFGEARILQSVEIPWGKGAGRFYTGLDVTEELRHKKELTIANKQLQEVSKAKSEFLASMSHELRTPLNSIIGFSEVLRDKTFGELNEKQVRYVGNVLTSGKHLLGLINDILDLSKVEAGKIELKYGMFSVADALSEVGILVKTMASKKNISLESKVEEGLSRISADPAKFKQIMYNLLSNAIKFTPDGGGDKRRCKTGEWGSTDFSKRHRHRDKEGGSGEDIRGVLPGG